MGGRRSTGERGRVISEYSRAIQAGRVPRRALVQPSALRGSALGPHQVVQGFLWSGLGNLKGWSLAASWGSTDLIRERFLSGT